MAESDFNDAEYHVHQPQDFAGWDDPPLWSFMGTSIDNAAVVMDNIMQFLKEAYPQESVEKMSIIHLGYPVSWVVEKDNPEGDVEPTLFITGGPELGDEIGCYGAGQAMSISLGTDDNKTWDIRVNAYSDSDPFHHSPIYDDSHFLPGENIDYDSLVSAYVAARRIMKRLIISNHRVYLTISPDVFS